MTIPILLADRFLTYSPVSVTEWQTFRADAATERKKKAARNNGGKIHDMHETTEKRRANRALSQPGAGERLTVGSEAFKRVAKTALILLGQWRGLGDGKNQ